MSAFFMKIFMPGLGGLLLFIIFFNTTLSSLDPDFGSGVDIGGIGLVFIMGAGLIVLGVVTMIVTSFFYRPFFRGEVLTQGTALLPLEKGSGTNAR